jgi:2,3-bisphosphoglycerate-independent phosphoglycerate mutase
MDLGLIKSLVKSAESKTVLLVMDGLGGVAGRPLGKTELQAAQTPYLDGLAGEGICGLHQPMGAGITPGSGPSHLALFGYDPVRYQIGRGVLSALGIGFDLQPNDVAARGNFCHIDEQGLITDRRAGRISTEENQRLCEQLGRIEVPGVQVFVQAVKEHRFLLVLRGLGLGAEVSDTDPQQTGKPPQEPISTSLPGGTTVRVVKDFLAKASKVLGEQPRANMILLRGFAQRPQWPSFAEAFGLKAAAIAGYPMYRGLAKLLGMEVLVTEGDIESEIDTLEQHWSAYDFFYVHIKTTDSAGEDGDFDRKVRMIEKVDLAIPRLRQLQPDVLVVTGDHSTPALLKQHSWHTVPTILWADNCRRDSVSAFDEEVCMCGGLGPHFPAVDLMPLILAHANRLSKFGA